jgi:steroid 5-alpha reductase family enzyme
MFDVFKNPPSDDWYLNGFVADLCATAVIFFSSFINGNSSMYDPAWQVFPLALCVFWMCAADNEVSVRGLIAFTLVFLWLSRFFLQWPWEGWTVGLKLEDWRYLKLGKEIGAEGHGWKYWAFSAYGFHLMPTLWVFFCVSPLQRVFMGEEQS